MPKIRSGEEILIDRAKDDCEFYYKEFRDILLSKINDDSEMKQILARFEKWLIEYRSYAKEWHKKNFIPWKDIYCLEKDANNYGSSIERPRAPFIPAFDEIKR